MSLSDTIKSDMKDAMRARDKARLGIVRMIMAAIKQREVDERTTLDDGQILAVLEKMVKQRRESAALFEKGNRPELAARELAEITAISRYLPEKLSDEEVAVLIDRAIAETAAEGPRDMGRVMAHLRKAAAGRIDMGSASAAVKSRLIG